jgi:iron complex outermembrane receptor protein
LPLEEVDRSVTVLNVRDSALVADSLADFLRLDSSLDLQERAPNGVQMDLSIRGGTFGQTLVLIDGVRMSDPQTGHHDLDIPVPLAAISRIEVLQGAGSTLYGSDAIGGVVNIITAPPEAPEIRLGIAGGSFGTNQQRLSIAESIGRFTEQAAATRDFSSGFMADRDYRNLAFSSQTGIQSSLGLTRILLGYADKPFGADQFYGPYNSWEDTKTWLAALHQALGKKTDVDFAFRRHSDLFVLLRDNPAVYTNHHQDATWQASLRRRETLFRNANFNYGVEGYRDSIVSNNLGIHSRQRVAVYSSADFRALKRFSLSLGAREEAYRKWAAEFCPTVSGGVWLGHGLKFRTSASRAFRVPSYTDLYYSDPNDAGNPNLKPERAWDYEAGFVWNGGGKLRAEVTAFQRRVSDGIDYLGPTANGPWQAANIDNLRFTGAEASVTLRPAKTQEVSLQYTGLTGIQEALGQQFSKYVFNYPSDSAVAAWRAALPHGILMRTRVGALNRRARNPYALWDVYGGYSRGRVHPFLQMTNLTNTQYQEIIGVSMPGRAFLGGLEIRVW